MSATLDDITRTDPSMAFGGASARPLPVLHVVHHPDPARIGARVLLAPGEELTLGRRRDDLGSGLLDDPHLSRRHASLAWLGSGVVVTDLDSRNGVWVNGQRVGRTSLAPGDVLGIGGILFLMGFGPARVPRFDGGGIVGRSAALAMAVGEIDAVAQRDTTVLFLGETGTGKEVAAAELHRRSGRKGAFVPVNCGALSANILQDELFGHVKGAFSGADGARKGLVAAAEGGTLFLDEIGDAPPDVQVSLLRLLQEREVRAVGADAPRKVDVRFVAATWKDLDAEVEAGRFRRDLAARLSRWVIRLPSLRERREDVPLLAGHFARQHAGRSLGLTRPVALRLLLHRWPANVRELEAVIERLVVTAIEGDALGEPAWLAEQLGQAEEVTGELPSTPGAAEDDDDARRPRARRPGEETLVRHLRSADGNVRVLASQLGVSRNTLYKWFRKYGIDPDAYR